MSRKRLLVRLLILLGVLTLVAVLVAFKISSDAEHGLRAEIDRAKAEGIWVNDFSDLDPTGPESQNGATAYVEAIKDYLALQGTNPPKSTRDACLTWVKKGAQFRFFSYKGDFLPGREHHSLAQMVGDLHGFVLAMAREAEATGKPKEALDDLVTAARMAHQLALRLPTDDPTGIFDGRVFAAFCDFLDRYPSMAKEASAVIDALGEPGSMVPRMREEMFFAFHSFDYPLPHGSCQLGDEHACSDEWLRSWPYFRLRFQTGVVSFYRSAIEEFEKNPLPSQNAAFMTKFETPAHKREPEGEHLIFFPPLVGRQARDYAVTVAIRRVMRQTIAILQLPKPPNGLPLGGEMAVDPSNDLPLNYVRTEKGFKVFAVGPHSANSNRKAAGLSTDVIFEFPSPKPGSVKDSPIH